MHRPSVRHLPLCFAPTRAEKTRLQYLLARERVLYEGATRGSIDLAVHHAEAALLRSEIGKIAAVVGQRVLGTDLPLTLQNERGQQCKRNPVVVYEISVSAYNRELVWDGCGVTVRKDGAVSAIRGLLLLSNVLVWRRHLDGSWAPLVSPTPGKP
jgi:hypothetical protein